MNQLTVSTFRSYVTLYHHNSFYFLFFRLIIKVGGSDFLESSVIFDPKTFGVNLSGQIQLYWNFQPGRNERNRISVCVRTCVCVSHNDFIKSSPGTERVDETGPSSCVSDILVNNYS